MAHFCERIRTQESNSTNHSISKDLIERGSSVECGEVLVWLPPGGHRLNPNGLHAIRANIPRSVPQIFCWMKSHRSKPLLSWRFPARLMRDAFLTELPDISYAGSRPLFATHSLTVRSDGRVDSSASNCIPLTCAMPGMPTNSSYRLRIRSSRRTSAIASRRSLWIRSSRDATERFKS
jgi:hypothetical protein